MLKFTSSRRLLGAAVAAVSLLALAPSTALAVKQTGGEYNTLYLNFNGDINKTFARDTEGLLSKAERNWIGLNK